LSEINDDDDDDDDEMMPVTTTVCGVRRDRRLTTQLCLCGGYNYDSTSDIISIRLAFDC